MDGKPVQILIWCLVGIFILTFAVKMWITMSPISYSGEIFFIVDLVNSLIRWPSILIALGLAIWQKQQATKSGQKPSRTWIWISLILGLAVLLIILFFGLIMMSAAYI